MKTILRVSLLVFLSLTFTKSFSQKADNPRKTKAIIKTSAECDFCKQSIEKELKKVKGIKKVSVDFKKHEVYVTYNSKKISLDDIRTKLTKMGYDADDKKASFDKYKDQ